MHAESPEQVFSFLQYVTTLLDKHKIWYCLAYGTLLGAVRDQDIIPWDYDFDLLIKPEDVSRVLSLNNEAASTDFKFQPIGYDSNYLAISDESIQRFWNCALGIFYQGKKMGDLYVFFPFSDGVLRRYDFNQSVYWCPHSSFSGYFIESTDAVNIRGMEFPAPRRADKWLEGVYGEDWQTPYRAQAQGGKKKQGVTVHGDRYHPQLKQELDWCAAQGWDNKAYCDFPEWPQPIVAAGPRGYTERTHGNSGALWWRDFSELHEHF